MIDHNSVALFDNIPERYLVAAGQIRQVFSDRSVGDNINGFLNCLSASPDWWNTPAYCRNDWLPSGLGYKTYNLTDYQQHTVPARIQFDPDPTLYNRGNWTYVNKSGTWTGLTQDFINTLAPQYINTKSVLSYQFSYLNVTSTDDIASPTTGFFARTGKYDIDNLEAYWQAHPDKTFILWTSSLSRSIGTSVSENFNSQMRDYARAHNMVLFDVADIESHNDQGNSCYDNRDGVQFCWGTVCENYPDDGLSLAAICQDWTTNPIEGHLGGVSGGGIAIAKAYWVMMARIAGWDGISP